MKAVLTFLPIVKPCLVAVYVVAQGNGTRGLLPHNSRSVDVVAQGEGNGGLLPHCSSSGER